VTKHDFCRASAIVGNVGLFCRSVALAICAILIADNAQATTLTTLVSFTGIDHQQPFTKLVEDRQGNLFGITLPSADFYNGGTVFELDTVGTLKTVVDSSEIWAWSGLTVDAVGNLLGTSQGGGKGGVGTVFKIDSSGKLTTLINFNTSNGSTPESDLLIDSSGNLFGTTYEGPYIYGDGTGYFNNGTVFEVDSSGVLTTLAIFDSSGVNGSGPVGGLIADAAGNLFGTTEYGGDFDKGTVFELDTTGTLKKLASFNGSNGAGPVANLIADSAGNMFGTTPIGGAYGMGTVFKLDSSGALTTLVDFNGNNGGSPLYGGLIDDSAGNLFGTSQVGGAYGFGTVFKLDKSGRLTTLVDFDSNNGDDPTSGLIADAAGNLFGITSAGGVYNFGTVFKVSDAGFVIAAAVPEPASWAMLIAGLGFTGTALRRRRMRAAA
jgi:uncharacterized repeat protein (TIGR03803 family)